MGVSDTAALDKARIILVDSISASARKAVARALEKKTLAELQAAVQEAKAKGGEIEQLWAKVGDPNATTVAKPRFQVQEIEDAKLALVSEESREARQAHVRVRLGTAANGHNPEKTAKALAEAERHGLSATEIEEATAALAKQRGEARAVEAMQLALESKDVVQLEAAIKDGEKAMVREATLNGFKRKLMLLTEPPKPKAEKTLKLKAEKPDKPKVKKTEKAVMLKQGRKSKKELAAERKERIQKRIAELDRIAQATYIEKGAELSEKATEAMADI